MKKLDNLLLQSDNDIPFEEALTVIHNPSLKEISMYGEEVFHIGLRFLLFSKNSLDDEDKSRLEGQSDFSIFMTVMNNRNIHADHKTNARKVLDLLFPGVQITFKKDQILLQKEKENIVASINSQNFMRFKEILDQMFCLGTIAKDQYNPKGALAKKIAEKLAKAHEKIDKMKNKKEGRIGIFDQYVSILSVGLGKDKNELMNYTVYQIRDEFKRYVLKMNSDIYLKTKLAGAQGLDEVENWMEELDSI